MKATPIPLEGYRCTVIPAKAIDYWRIHKTRVLPWQLFLKLKVLPQQQKKKKKAEAKAKAAAKPAPKAAAPAPKAAPAQSKPTASPPAVNPALQAQFDAYEKTGIKLTEANKQALARQMGIDYGGSTYYGTASSDTSSKSNIVSYSKNSGIGSKQPNPPSKGWGNW